MGRPNKCNCICGKCYITAVIISIYDESSPVYTDGSIYFQDFQTWTNFINEVKLCTSQKIRLGIMVPAGPFSGGNVSDIKNPAGVLPGDTDRDIISFQGYTQGSPRITSSQIVDFFNTILNNPESSIFEDGPQLLLFCLDNSGSIFVSEYIDELNQAKLTLSQMHPGMTILDDISNQDERWLRDAYSGIVDRICPYKCCQEQCYEDISTVDYDPTKSCGLSEEEFNARKGIGGPVRFFQDGIGKTYISSQLEVESNISQVNAMWSYGNNDFYTSITANILGDFTGTYPNLPINQYLKCGLSTYNILHQVPRINASGTLDIGQQTYQYNGFTQLESSGYGTIILRMHLFKEFSNSNEFDYIGIVISDKSSCNFDNYSGSTGMSPLFTLANGRDSFQIISFYSLLQYNNFKNLIYNNIPIITFSGLFFTSNNNSNNLNQYSQILNNISCELNQYGVRRYSVQYNANIKATMRPLYV